MNYLYALGNELASLTIEMAKHLRFGFLFTVIAALIAVLWHFFSATASVPIAAVLLLIGLLKRLDINLIKKRQLKTFSYV
jgi:Flp pilus assembly protein TadB